MRGADGGARPGEGLVVLGWSKIAYKRAARENTCIAARIDQIMKKTKILKKKSKLLYYTTRKEGKKNIKTVTFYPISAPI